MLNITTKNIKDIIKNPYEHRESKEFIYLASEYLLRNNIPFLFTRDNSENVEEYILIIPMTEENNLNTYLLSLS